MHQYFEWIYLQYTGIPIASHSNFSLFWKQFQRTKGMAIRVCWKWIHPKQYKRLLLRYSFGANMKSYSIPQYERQQHRTITSLSPQSNIVLAERDWCTEFTSVSVGSSPRSYSFTSVTVVETGARSFTPLQNLRRDHRSFAWTEAPSGVVFVCAQDLSGIVWTEP